MDVGPPSDPFRTSTSAACLAYSIRLHIPLFTFDLAAAPGCNTFPTAEEPCTVQPEWFWWPLCNKLFACSIHWQCTMTQAYTSMVSRTSI